MPKSLAARVTWRRAIMPRRCPSIAGRPRSLAQRRFPSMMIATCRGTLASRAPPGRRLPARGSRPVRLVARRRGRSVSIVVDLQTKNAQASRNRSRLREERAPAGGCALHAESAAPALRQQHQCPRSHFHDLFFFGDNERVDLLDVLIGQPLQRLLHSLVVVFGDVGRFQLTLQLVVRPVPHVANGDPAVLRLLLDQFRELFTPLFVERRNRRAESTCRRCLASSRDRSSQRLFGSPERCSYPRP